MMSALECFQRSAHCEAMARACCDRMSSRMLHETTEHWRTLGAAAATAESPVGDGAQAGQSPGGGA